MKLAELALAEANQKLAEQTARAGKLARENQALQSRVQALLAGPEAMAALRGENALLKKQLASLKQAAPNAAEAARLNSELDGARKQIAALQSAAEVGFLEKAALENRVRQLQISAVNSAPVAPPPGQAENEARIRALTQERNDLLAKLGEANRELYGRRKQDAAARINVLTDEVNALRARLAVDEAQVIPYTPEELALFKQPAPQLANRDAEKKSIKELPGGAAQLVAEAQHYFSAGQYDKAEDDYRKFCSAMKTTDWCWPTWQRLKWNRASWLMRKNTSPPPLLKSERCLQPFDSGLPEIPPGKIRRRARRVEPRGEAGSPKS